MISQAVVGIACAFTRPRWNSQRICSDSVSDVSSSDVQSCGTLSYHPACASSVTVSAIALVHVPRTLCSSSLISPLPWWRTPCNASTQNLLETPRETQLGWG